MDYGRLIQNINPAGEWCSMMKLITCAVTITWLLGVAGGQSYLEDGHNFVAHDSESDQNGLRSHLKHIQERNEDNRRGIHHYLRRFSVRSTQKPTETWTGRWLPPRPTAVPSVVADAHHGVAMGISSTSCDDAKTNLTVDWNFSAKEHTCYNPTHRIHPNPDVVPVSECEEIREDYFPQHICMDKPIKYNASIPTHGDHRPLWPRYGEYKYLPVQRWLHSLEHGAIVMLYHPCANPVEVAKLKHLVEACLWRHIITPYRELSSDRPMALVAWGCRLELSTVNPFVVKHFIQSRALKGPEKVFEDGQYDLGLVRHSNVLKQDEKLCP